MRTVPFCLFLLSGQVLAQAPRPAPPLEALAQPARSAAPVETEPPNVPEHKPAFPGQTRAPAIRTRTAIKVTEIAQGFNKPWALSFLPDRRMLVTEKPTGSLYIVTPEGKRSKPVAALPKVDGRDQGGLLDVEVSPDYAKSGLIYWTYYEPREGGNGLAVEAGLQLQPASVDVPEHERAP